MACALLLVTLSSAVLAQEAYPGPANADPIPTVILESYPGADVLVPPAQVNEQPSSAAYPDPVESTTGPAVPSADQSSGEQAVATPVPMPSVPVDSGSQVSLILVGLVLVGLIVVVGLILARRRR